jgi:tetratricopeptide (TPR) repeat protein
LYEQFRQQSDLSSLQKCIEVYHALLAEKADGADRYSIPAKQAATNHSSALRTYHVLIQLARAHEARFYFTGQLDDLHSAIESGQDALGASHAEKTLCPTAMVYYAKILEAHATYATSNGPDSEPEELQIAKALCRRAIALLHVGKQHTLWAVARNLLGWTTFRSWEATGNIEHLEEAISLQRSALAETSTSPCHDKHWYLRCLGVEFRERFERSLDPRDLDESISFLEEAMKLCDVAHFDREVVATDMVQGLARKYVVCGVIKYLDQAQEIGRQALSLPDYQAFGNRGDRRTHLLSAMSIIHMLRYMHSVRHDADIHKSISLSREALQCCSLSDRNRWALVRNLATGLILQFELEGDLGNLEEAAQLIGQMLAALPDHHPARPELNIVKAKVMAYRFDAMRDISHLNSAIDLSREAIADARAVDPAYTLDLVTHLCDRFQVLHEADDLEQAIPMLDQVLESVPEGHMLRLDAVHQMSKALLLRGQHVNLDDCEDINRAICEITRHQEELLQSIFRPESLRTLAACYFVRYRRDADTDDARRAFDLMTDLLRTVTPGRRHRYSCLVYAAELHLEDTPYRDIAMALELASAALLESQRDVRSRLHGVKAFLDTITARYSDIFAISSLEIQIQLLDMYALLIALLPRIAFFGLHLQSRLQSLSVGQNIALTAASHALNLSLPDRALEILEQGRAVFWQHALRFQSAFDDVPEKFRSQLLCVSRKLERVSDVPRHGSNRDPESVEAEIAERRQQSEEFHSLVEQIRCVPGMARFLLHECYSTLAKVAERGPVVVLVSSPLASHAIVIKPSGQALGVPLDTLTDKWLVSSGVVWRSAVTEARSIVKGSRKMVKSTNPPKLVKAGDILRRLWESVVWPVISALGLQVCGSTPHKTENLYLMHGITDSLGSQSTSHLVVPHGTLCASSDPRCRR